MKKSAFVNLTVGVVAGLLFSVGMCMCLIPEWEASRPGILCAAIGGVILAVQAVIAFVKSGKRIRVDWKLTGKIVYGILSALVLGVGMCLIMVWNMMLPGIAVGIVGIVMLLMLVPMCVGLK